MMCILLILLVFTNSTNCALFEPLSNSHPWYPLDTFKQTLTHTDTVPITRLSVYFRFFLSEFFWVSLLSTSSCKLSLSVGSSVLSILDEPMH